MSAIQKTEHPLRIFISYGHPESPIVQRIYDALIQRGHTVWFDRESLKFDEDWRAKIQSGIAQSDIVLACLSAHSTRPKGVCLDELAIAVGVKGNNVKSILLAPENVLEPPAFLTSQWLRMEDWQEQEAAGKEVFEEWFAKKMDTLFPVLESRETREFDGQIQTLHQTFSVYNDTSVQANLLPKKMYGREWLAEKLSAWLHDPQGARMMFVSGEPGVGKSMFAVHYTHYHPDVAAFFSFRRDMSTLNSPLVVLQTLAYKLACRLPPYRERLVALVDKIPVERILQYNPKEFFSHFLQEPLQETIDGGHPRMAIVLDGLDECGDPDHNVLAKTISEYQASLPGWLRVLVFARAEPVIIAYCSGAERLDISQEVNQNLNDIRDYFTSRLESTFAQDPRWESSLAALTERSQGIFLYAEMMSNLLPNRGTLSAANEYPVGLDAVFTEWFDYFFPDRDVYRQFWRTAIGCLLVAPESLPLDTLRQAMGWKRAQMNDFSTKLSVLLSYERNGFGDETLTIRHAFIREWLERRGNLYYASPEDGADAIADLCLEKLKDGEELSLYEAAYLSTFLKRAGRESDLKLLAKSDAWFEQVSAAGKCLYQNCTASAALKYLLSERLDVVERFSALLHDPARKLHISRFMLGFLAYSHNDKKAMELLQKDALEWEPFVELHGTFQDNRELAEEYRILYLCYTELHRAELSWKFFEPDKNRSAAKQRDLLVQKRTKSLERAVRIGDCFTDKEALADQYRDTGMYRKEAKLRQQMIQELAAFGYAVDLIKQYQQLGWCYSHLHNTSNAQKAYEKALQLQYELHPDDLLSVIRLHQTLCLLYRMSGDASSELTMMEYVLPLYLKESQRTPIFKEDVFRYYARAAFLCQKLNHTGKAIQYYQSALDTVRELQKPDDFYKQDLAMVYRNIAKCYAVQGEEEKASYFHAREDEIWLSISTDNHYQEDSISHGWEW